MFKSWLFIRTIVISVLLSSALSQLNAQNQAVIYGSITDTTGNALPYVNISIPALNKGIVSNHLGKYQLEIPSGQVVEVQYSLVGFLPKTFKFSLSAAQRKEVNIRMQVNVKALDEVSVTHKRERISEMTRLSIREFEMLPNPSGSVESFIKTLPGVSSSNELSSQYSVRGGNFDENLIYVNDIEIIRPFLIRSGQQEGLSFINSDLVGGIKFSAGGFEAKYGDKMSSVLDVTYRMPQKFGSNVSFSLLGGAVSVEGTSENNRFSFISGVRYKTSKLLLGSLDSKGEYVPNFTDWQMMLHYKPNNRLIFSILSNFSRNAYSFIPQTRETNFGTFAQVYNLKVYYDGREDDQYNSSMVAGTVQYQVKPNLTMKIIGSFYSTYEQERYDILGEYLINELDAYPGSDTYGDSILNLGVGGMLNHARNYLMANIASVSYIGTLKTDVHALNWSLKYQQEHFRDYMREWDLIDSAGYSSPYSEQQIQLNNYVYSENDMQSHRITGHFQDALSWEGLNASYMLNAGLRFHYWSFSDEKLLSPRVRFSVKPNWERDVAFFAAAGVYYQPPFFKEMRNFKGELNPSIKSQQSFHLLTGADYNLTLWDRPFKYTCELYYKYLKNLIPYKIDNVRVRYTATNNAKGYATGIDMKLYGEFVEGLESWASLSLLSTKEDLKDDYYFDSKGNRVVPGYYHRPTDQLFHINVVFQDYLPNNPSFKASLNLVYGSSFYIAPPRSARFDLAYPLGSYRRVDLGLSKTFKTPWLPQLKSFWIGVEVFNLFDIRNKASLMWVQTVSNQEGVPNLFGVPNYLTSRRLNAKVSLRF